MFLKILSAANSPLNGLPGRVYSADYAIVLLGFENIKKIVKETDVKNNPEFFDSSLWYRNSFWRHSVMVVNTAKQFAEDFNYRKTDYISTAAFLHDIGILIIREFFPDEYEEINLLATEQNINRLKAEEIVLGTNHSEIGKMILQKMNLPDLISEAVKFHHLPSKANEALLISAIIHLSDLMISFMGMSNIDWDNDLQVDDNIISILNLNSGRYGDQLTFVFHELLQEIINKNRTQKRNDYYFS